MLTMPHTLLVREASPIPIRRYMLNFESAIDYISFINSNIHYNDVEASGSGYHSAELRNIIKQKKKDDMPVN